MKKISLALYGLLSAASLCANIEDRPNVIIIYGDDVGYGDVGAYGSEKIPTPHTVITPTQRRKDSLPTSKNITGNPFT